MDQMRPAELRLRQNVAALHQRDAVLHDPALGRFAVRLGPLIEAGVQEVRGGLEAGDVVVIYPANFYNVWLDIKPAKGHRVLMCAYPGAMQSGMDYYMNDAGLLIAETTIAQTRFNPRGQSEASRIRQAIQYASNIDAAVAILQKDNNGLYTNEWLLGDINTNEIVIDVTQVYQS